MPNMWTYVKGMIVQREHRTYNTRQVITSATEFVWEKEANKESCAQRAEKTFAYNDSELWNERLYETVSDESSWYRTQQEYEVTQVTVERRWASACTNLASTPNSWARSMKRWPPASWSSISSPADVWVDDWVGVIAVLALGVVDCCEAVSLIVFIASMELNEAKVASFPICWPVNATRKVQDKSDSGHISKMNP